MKLVNGILTEDTEEDLAQRVIDEALHEANKASEAANLHNQPIIDKLKTLDQKTIRALRESNQDRLKQLEAEAAELRKGLIK